MCKPINERECIKENFEHKNEMNASGDIENRNRISVYFVVDFFQRFVEYIKKMHKILPTFLSKSNEAYTRKCQA